MDVTLAGRASFSAWTERSRTSLWWLLLSSGLFGAAFGAVTATWQASIETSQVLLGLVHFDSSSLPYAYHASTISLINLIGCVFLMLTDSEVTSSILLASLVGAVSLQALALIVFQVLRDAHCAALIAIALGGINCLGAGISYPILFMGTPHVYGRAGLIVAVYALGLLGLSRYRSGFLLCGLALAVHPPWGLWLNGCVLLALLIGRRRLGEIVCRRNVAYYCAGLSLAIAMFAWQKLSFPVDLGGTIGSADESRNAFLGYIRNWDHHRQRFDDPAVLVPGLLYGLLGVSFLLRHRETFRDAGGRLFLLVATVSAIASAPLIFIPSWFDPALFPQPLVAAMPGRFVNLTIFLATPLWVARLAALLKQRHASAWLAVLLTALLSMSVGSISGHDLTRSMWVLLCMAVLATLALERGAAAASGGTGRSRTRDAADLLAAAFAFGLGVWIAYWSDLDDVLHASLAGAGLFLLSVAGRRFGTRHRFARLRGLLPTSLIGSYALVGAAVFVWSLCRTLGLGRFQSSWLAPLAVVVIALASPLGERVQSALDRFRTRSSASFDMLVVGACVLAILVLPGLYLARNAESIARGFEKLELPPGVRGNVLVTFDRWLLQLETRRPALVPHLDGYAYLGPGAMLALDEFTTDLFGISMKKEPSRPMTLHASVLMTQDYAASWEDRTCDEWAALAEKFGFGLVVAPGDLTLRLPRADDDVAWGKYFPRCSDQPE